MAQTQKTKITVNSEGRRSYNMVQDEGTFFNAGLEDILQYCGGEAKFAARTLRDNQMLEITVSYRIVNK